MQLTNQQSFDDTVLQSQQPVVVDFWADWCGPCHRLAPILADVAEKYSTELVVAKVNVDDLPELANQHQVSALPTLVIFDQGREVDRLVGLVDADTIEAAVAPYLVNDRSSGSR
ncbi:MAG: thioredoxin [Pirellulaceae bacterium]|nr:thioredoxin [Pirellulaceae bacterium]